MVVVKTEMGLEASAEMTLKVVVQHLFNGHQLVTSAHNSIN